MNLDVTLDERQLVDSAASTITSSDGPGRVPGAAQWPRGVSALPLLLLAACLRLLLRCPPVRCPACSLPTALHTTARCALHSRALSCIDRARRSFPQVYYVDVLDVFEGDYLFLNLACCMPHARRHARRRHARSLIVCFLGCS